MSEPGARLVFTHGFTLRPRLTAFLASSPAPIITLGFDVLVQLVIAATTTEPWSSPSIPGMAVSADATAAGAAAPAAAGCACSPGFPAGGAFGFRSENISSRACWNLYFACRSDTRACGPLGPAGPGSALRSAPSVV